MSQRVGTVLDGKYDLTRLLGEGGMGAVFEATHTLIGRRLAVKFLHPQFATSEEVIERFHREAQAAARIGHENIIDVTDMGMADDGAPYIVMEFLEGTDVRGLIEEGGAVPVKRAAHIMVQALSALQAAHEAGIIHRDLKPDNIFLTQKSTNPDYVKLLDFGISKFRALESDDVKGLTQTGTVLGTPHYMSPEQARGDQDISARSDIYAMGVILYQMLTGQLPFDAANYNALLIKILTEEPVPPEELAPDLPEDVVAVVKRAMARDPADRFEDAAEFRRHLLPFAPGMSDLGTELSAASRTEIRKALYSTATPFEMSQSGIGKSRRRLPWIVGGAAAAVVGVVAAIVLAVGGGEEASGEQQGASEKLAAAGGAVAAAAEDAGASEEEEEASDEEGEAESAESEGADEAGAETVTVAIRAEPKEAVIEIDGVDVGSNPFEGPFASGEALRTVEVAAPGYRTHKELVRFDEDKDLSFSLDKRAAGRRPKKGGGKQETVLIKKKKSEKKSGGGAEADKGEKKQAASGGGKKKKDGRKIDYDDPWKD
ncbi:MAG: serine/threonine-protein kinase [Polyangia bacterium]